MKKLSLFPVVVALAASLTLLALPTVSRASNDAEVIPQQGCGIVVDGELVLEGMGFTVITPSGGRTVTCRAVLPAGFESTVIQLVGEPKGNILVMTRSGYVIVVLTVCGPSEPTDVCA